MTGDDRPSPSDCLSDAQQRFISLWGQMGPSWGIPRTMAQVHALLFITGEPMNTDEIMQQLRISRGSASMTLRGLMDWGVVQRVHHRGDRKEYYAAEQDIWRMFRTIIAQRKKREIDPLLQALQSCRQVTDIEPDRRIDPDAARISAHNQRLDELILFMRIVDSISQRFISPTGEGLQLAAKLLDQVS